ncbi:MAG: hypothetical protein JWQ55_6266 [Rhodopila sp.]|nr:hypothetical protein [Rhodopila sp.]
MNDDLPADLDPVVDFFGLNGPATVTKDFHVVAAIAAITALDAAPFALVFGGGTALARAHKLVQRMSEDVDFKIVPLPTAPTSRNGQRRALGDLTDKVTTALQMANFAFDPADPAHTRSRNENRYTIWQLPYAAPSQGLRPTIQIELTYAPMRRSPVPRSVSSFVAEAFNRPPEVPNIPCVSVTETAAEKLVALTRRVAMELAGLSRDRDPTLIRHVYDLHMMHAQVDPTEVATLAREIAAADADVFRNQYPAYAADIAGETGKALDTLNDVPEHRERYDRFVADMAYGERPAFATAMQCVNDLAKTAWGNR